MYSDQLPFARGKVFGITSSTDGAHLLGQEFVVEDTSPTDPIKKRSNRLVHIRAVRNSAGAALLPKRIARYKVATNHSEVDGYTRLTAEYYAGIVDEFLPAAGAASNEVFYITVKGPSLVLMPLSNLSADVAQDDILVSITAVTSGATTAGRLGAHDMSGATAVLGAQIINRIGRAMSTALTNDTNTSLLVDVRCDY
jgi:hypothetical protein